MLTEEQKEKIEEEKRSILDNIKTIRHRILVFSGKGGVGKTTVSVNLAYGLRARGYETGLLDADITGPNVPKMLGLGGDLRARGNKIIPQTNDGVKVVSIGNFLQQDQPVIWRGPLRSKILHQFLGDVEWGRLDYLIADLPPGTGDEIITLVQKMNSNLAIIVTTPQEVALIDSARAINMAKAMDVPKIAVIENMSGLICPNCGGEINLFGAGGGRKQAERMNVSFLGRLPIDIEAREMADKGRPVILANTDAQISIAMADIITEMERIINDQSG